MLDIRKDKFVQEDVVRLRQLKHQQIRDILLELEQLDAALEDDSLLLTRDETANKLRCDPKKIPSKIPRIRVGKERLFQLGDIRAFIEGQKR